MDKLIKLKAFYEQDSKRYHRFLIDANEWGIVGRVYVPKGTDPIPVRMEVSIETLPPVEVDSKDGREKEK